MNTIYSLEDSIIVNYTNAIATSQISNSICYYGKNSNPTEIGEFDGNNCVFNNLDDNVIYYFKKCSISNSNLISCSTVNNVFHGKIYTFNYTGNYQNITLSPGYYKFELWGAQGGNESSDVLGSLGGYTSGYITPESDLNIYVYVGQNNSTNDSESFNGGFGSQNGVPGGGATDIRLISGDWDDFESLKSRIMVAAGGGTSCYNKEGYGGGLIGGTAILNNINGGTGGTQTSPGITNHSCASEAKFGIGGSCGGGGGGYYGGAGSAYIYGGGGGGSSFISGHNGCDAIAESSTSSNIVHTSQSMHYSGIWFVNTTIIDGAGYNWTTEKTSYVGMPTYDGINKMTGNKGHGYAKITTLALYE